MIAYFLNDKFGPYTVSPKIQNFTVGAHINVLLQNPTCPVYYDMLFLTHGAL